MLEDLKVTIIQTLLHWENPNANRKHFENKINSISEETDLIVLPEMFTTGFTMQPNLHAEKNGTETLNWLQKLASKKKCVITGSVCIEENGQYFNRLYWVKPDGTYNEYNKRHLFRMAGEDQHYVAGTNKIICEIKGWKICPLICYDLRFPVFSRNTWDENINAEYDLLLYVANWPAVRSFPWSSLLVARAIENQSYVIGLNRIGEDGNNFPHSGDSAILNPRGEKISSTLPNQDSVETISLNYEYLVNFRKQFPVGMDADSFYLK